MYTSINPYENIESFKDCGRKKVVESFEWHKFNESWTRYFWAYYYQFGMLTHFHYWVFVIEYLTYAIIFIPWIILKITQLISFHALCVLF
jgi:hypothetical protein